MGAEHDVVAIALGKEPWEIELLQGTDPKIDEMLNSYAVRREQLAAAIAERLRGMSNYELARIIQLLDGEPNA